jgi:hypothetical protein
LARTQYRGGFQICYGALSPSAMPEIKEGSFELDLGLVKLGAELSEDDRQCAWELIAP